MRDFAYVYVILLFFFVLTPILASTETNYPELPIKPEIYHWELDNGLNVLFWRIREGEVISIRVYVLTGSMYEDKWLGSGISHYCEHVVSSGTTRRRSEEEYKKILFSIGGRNNAYTTNDETCYHITTLTPYFYIADSILFEWVSECKFEPFEVEREKGVIQEEIMMQAEEPSRIIWHIFSENIFLNHPARFPVIGYLERFKSLKRDDLVKYYRERYQPQNTILSISGPLEPDSVYSECLRVWGKWARGSYYQPVLPEEPRFEVSRVVEKNYHGKISFFMLGFRGVQSGSPMEYPLEFVSYILTGNETGRLKKKLKYELGIVSSVWSYNSSNSYGANTFVIGGEFEFSKKDTLLRLILDEIEKLAEFGPTEDELITVKESWYRGLFTSFEGAERLASIAANNWKQYRSPFPYREIIEKAYGVNAYDVREACKEILKDKPYIFVVLKGDEDISAKSLDKGWIKAASCDTLHKIRLENGVKIIYACNGDVPFFDIAIYVGGGVRFDPEQHEGLSSLLASYLTESTKNMTKERIFKTLDRLGATLSVTSGNNTIGISMKFPAQSVDTALNILSDIIFNPGFDSIVFPRLKKEKLASIKRQESSWGSKLWKNFRQNFFTNHPYKRNPDGSEESIEIIGYEDVVRLYRALFVGGNVVVAISGPERSDKILPQIIDIFSKIPSGEANPPMFKSEPPISRDTVIIIPTKGEQASFIIGFDAPHIGDSLTAVAKLIDAMLSGVSVPRGWLYESLRGKRDLVYYISAGLWQGPDIGVYTISAQTSLAKLNDVLNIISKQIKKLQNGKFSDVDIEQAKKLLLIDRSFSTEYQSSRVSEWALNELLLSDHDHGEKMRRWIQGVTKDDIIRYANKYFVKSKTIILKPQGKM